ncbi:gliding motility-associated C-terminal domain-containing protein [Chitinophagaceae bacterium 26-R-25]|nr:gliding motility-associated C-terminal domain-containing protein [Chitinophagaceae bacterium 26-R-25]
MRTKYAFHFCVFVLLFIAPRVFAQDFTVGTGSVGNGATTFPSPLPGAFEGSRSQYLFRASELQAAGLTRGFITALKFNVLSLNNAGALRTYSLKMDTTSVNSLQSATWENSPAVSYTVSSLTPVLGVNTLTFANKYFWNGTSNILVEICVNGGSGINNFETANPTVAWTTGLSFNASHTYGANDIASFCTIGTTTELGTATTRPNITFSWIVAPPDCSGTPDGGSVASTKTQVCPTDNFFLSSTYTAAMGLSTQWQYSTDNVTWKNITGATKDTITTSLANTTPLAPSTYYRQMITCIASGKSTASTSVLVNRTAGVQGVYSIDNTKPTDAVVAKNFNSFNDAYLFIKCGISGPIVFNVAKNASPYNEQLIINSVFGTSATNTITFNGNGATLNYLATTAATAPVIRLNGAHHVIIDSLNITALGTVSQFGWGVHLTNDADSNTISRCNITVDAAQATNNFAGIVMSGGTNPATSGSYCDSNTIRNNTIRGGQYAISIVGGTSSAADYPVNRNQILNNTIQDYATYGIYMNNNLLTRVEGNDISRPLRSTTGGTLYGVYLTQTNVGNFISKNKIHAMFNASYTFSASFYGIYFSNATGFAGSENVASNNQIYDIKCLGTIYGLANNGSSFANYYYNTVVIDDIATAATTQTYGFYATNQVAMVDIKNNIFSIVRGGTALKYGMCMASSSLSLFTINYNNYFSNGHPTYSTGYYNGKSFATLTDWQNATKFDTTSVSIDPGFKNLATGDLTPTSAAMMNKGTPVATLDDIANLTRDTKTPDVGAVEYNLPGCTTSFLPGNAFANVGYATCVGKSVILNLRNNDVGLGLTYQWQTATDVAGTWSNLSTAMVAPPYTFNAGNNTIYYRAAVACNGGTPQYTAPIQIVIGGYFPAGTYTIDQTQLTDPVGTKNFNSFKDAASAISCGIAGPVVFNAKPGVYNEHIRIGAIGNSSAVNTVTFQSESGNPAGTELTFNAPDGNNNYTVQLDSASNVTFKNLTVSATNAVYARAFDLMNTASSDSIVNCVVNSVKPNAASYPSSDQTAITGIYAGTNYTGGKLVIKGNTFHKGAKGIYINGLSTPLPVATVFFTQNNVIEGNLFDSCYHHCIYVGHASSIKVVNNTVPVKTTYSNTSTAGAVYGINMNDCDSAILVAGNYVTLENNAGLIYGIYVFGNNATPNARGKIINNKVYGLTGLTNMVVGLYNGSGTGTTSSYTDVMNNEISVSTPATGAGNLVGSAGIVTQNATYTNYYNNSLLNTSPASGIYNVAFWVDHGTFNLGGNTNIFNNIMANQGGGPAIYYLTAVDNVKVDYNMMYTSGPVLVNRNPSGTTYPDLPTWRKAYGTDFNSIVYKPAFTSTTNLQPLASDPNSWAMQGRGVHIAGNNVDINGNARPVLLTDGVPDMGAYEFDPTVAPPDLVATPATPAPGITQSFSFGTDTVTRITWDPSAAVPTAISLKRYSGRIPAGLNPTTQSMYYYVAANVTGAGPFKYKMQQTFINPWMRNLPNKSLIKTGQTDATNAWVVSGASVIDSFNNIYSDAALTMLDKFTGMTDGKIPAQPVYTTTPDSSTRGTRFWVPYTLAFSMLSQNVQQFKFAIASHVATQVTVSVHGTGYSKTYSVPADSLIITDEVPKSGINDARLMTEGLSDRAVLIESKDPISVILNCESFNNLATSAVIMPTGTYAKEYTTLGVAQFSPGKPEQFKMGTSWVTVVADNDNTVVQITPSGATTGGLAAGVPVQLTLNRGQAYQILGAFIRLHPRAENGGSGDTYESYDLTGTKIVSLPNSAGKCMPIAVFNGSSGTNVTCQEDQSNGDVYMFQQTFPLQAWGKKFLTAPLATRNSKSQLFFSLYRVMVKDPSTVVKVNGTVLTGLRANTFYQFSSRIPQLIEANKPIMVAQCMTQTTGCGNDEYSSPGGMGSINYLTPVGLGVNNAIVFRKSYDVNYVTAIVPTKALSSFKIDNSNTFDSTYVHPQNSAYTVVVKRFATAPAAISVITCDSNFTALFHMPVANSVNAYSYNIGFQVPRVNVNSYINNTYSNTVAPSAYTCAGTTFKPTIYLPVAAKSITWKLSAAPGATPATDVTVNNPVAVDTVEINSQDYYEYRLNQAVSFSATGNDTIPVTVVYGANNPLSCDQTLDGKIPVVVKQAPDAEFTVVYDNCVFTTAQFTATGNANNSAAFDRWNWNFGDNTTATGKTPTKKWNQTGLFNIGLLAIANDGCYDSTSQKIQVNTCDNVFIPNSFTPNGDGHNDQFKLYASNVSEMKMMIFNQWGQKIFETTNMANGWDGTLNGKAMPSGVYMYVCRIVLTSGDIIDKKGSINLLR